MLLCQVLGVSRAGYYKWLKRKTTAEEIRINNIIQTIIDVNEEVDGIYGYRRMTIYMNHFCEEKANHKCVYRVMSHLGIKSVIRKKRYRYKPHKQRNIAENVLNREFKKAYRAKEVLLTDVTELKYSNHSKAYLSAVLDYGGKKIIVWKLGTSNNNHLVAETFNQIENQLLPHKTLIHSDRGYQYTSHWFKEYVERNKVIQSMSRPGYCIDNGPMESFWGILKDECYRRKHFETFEDLEDAINTYIEFYNSKRISLSMGLKIPVNTK
ncbi:IS3 family transposase [Aerococcus viridans]|uniref:IS3 family transposase n=1 Tax=Aerococcus viridans TaxID=1377 RepID=UPI003AA87CB6